VALFFLEVEMSSSAVLSVSDPVALEVILGVDTHRDVHTAAVVSTLGAVLACREFAADAGGYEELLEWALGHGVVRRAGVECTGSYGAGLSRRLQAADIAVVDVNQPDRRARRQGKTDVVDATAAARAVLAGRAEAIAKSGAGEVEAVRILKLSRDSAVHARTKAINQLKALLVTADPVFRSALHGLGSAVLIRRCAELPLSTADTPAQEATRYALRSLANRIQSLNDEAAETERRIAGLVTSRVPELLARTGVGPDSAAALLVVAGDNADRIRHEGSFAALCGVSPVEASSGNTQRRRLNRGGDRQANAALHRIVITRLRWDSTTQDYMRRRLAEGKTRREIIRCLKRYVAREVFMIIQQAGMPVDTAATAD
jgi:transposase